MDEFAGHSGINWRGDVGVVKYGPGDSGMVVMFFLKPIHNPAKSTETGRPYFDDKVFVRIHPPGERLNIVEREATDNDKRRFALQWAQFVENKDQVNEGTPIDLLFASSPSVAAALKASGVYTVEQCAELSAHAIETIGMGAQTWVNQAAKYLEVANKGVKASQLRAEIDAKDREIGDLKHKLDLVMAELNHIRDQSSKAVTMEDVQRLMGNQGGNGRRGVFVPNPNKNFDAQAAQINATHVTSDIAKSKKAATPQKRLRARLG